MKILNSVYNIKSDINKKIILISDLHYKNKNDIKRLNIILENIEKLNPDYICIPGDLIDSSNVNDVILFINWLKKLAKITRVIVSLGNHEFYINKHKKIYGINKNFIKKISSIENLYLLDNKNIIIDNINFIGLTIPIEYYNENFYKCLKNINIDTKYYNILLCHSPEYILNKELLKDINIDLILCGHMHGGITPLFLRRIFKNNGIISPTKKLFPKNVYGYFNIENTSAVVTSGVRVLPYKTINKLFKPEIVEINLK